MKQVLLVTVLLLSAILLTGCISGQGGSKAPNCGQGSTFDTKTRTCSSAGSSDGGGRVDATIYEDSGFNTLDLPVVYVGNRLAEVCNVINYSAGIGDPAPYAPVCRCSQGVCRVTVYPTKDYTGMTSLSYNLSNAVGTSGTYDMFINVLSRNDNPGNATSSVNIYEDKEEIIYLNYADVDDITVQATSCSVDYLTELTEISPCACYGGVCSIVVKYSGATDPSAGVLYTGPQLRYTVQVDGYDTGRSYVAVNVVGVDDPPYNEISTTETNIGVQYEDFPLTSITLSFTDPDGIGPYTCTTSNLVGITAGACSCSGLNICTVSIAGEAEYYTDGTANKASFNYQITSSAGSSVPRYINGTSESDEAVEITIDSVNDSPTFTNISSGGNSYICGNTINALEDEPLVITVNIDEGGGTDEDSQDLKIEVLSSDDNIINGQPSTPTKDIGINLKHGATELNYNDDLVSIPNAATSAGASDVTITLTPEPGASTTLTTITINAEDDGPSTSLIPPLHINQASCQLIINFAEVDDPPTVFKGGVELLDKETNEGDRLRIGSIKIDEGGGTVEDPQGIYVSILTDNRSLLPSSNMELYNEATPATPMTYYWADVAYSPASDNCCGAGTACNNTATGTAGTPDGIVTSATVSCVYLDIAGQKCYRSQTVGGTDWDEGPCINSYTTSGCSGNNCLGKASPASSIIPDAVGVLYYAMEEDKCYISSGLTAMDWAETGCGKKYLIDSEGGVHSSGDDSYQLKVDPVANISGEVTINIHAQDYITVGAGFNIATSFLTGEFKLTVHSIGAIHNGWKDLKAVGPKYAFDGELLAEPYVELGWEPFLLAGSGSNSAAVINGYNVFRREAGVDYDFSSPINSELVASTVYTYKDEDFSSTSIDDLGKVYYYIVRPVDSINNLSSPTNEIFKEIRIILPPKNRVFVHRWIVNKEVCGLLKKDSDGTHNFRCEYYGPGRGSVAGYYDIGQDLIVDMFEAGCPYTSAYDSDGACGHNGCVGIGAPGSTAPFNSVTDDGYVYYDRSSGLCYIYDSSGAGWTDISTAIAGLNNDFADMTDNAWLAPLTHINQSDSNVTCGVKTPIEVEFTAAAANIALGVSRLPSRREQIAYSSWDSGYSDSEISNIESGLAISSSSKCNSTSGSGITEWYTDTELPLGKFRTTIPGTKASEIRSVMTGSDITASCSSKYGVQDFVGNVGEWATDQIRCTDSQTCAPVSPDAFITTTDFADSADLNSPNGLGGYDYALDGETGPCNDEDANGSCDAPLDGWHFYEEKHNAGYFIIPMGLPADGDYPTDYFLSETGKSMLQIGNSSGITSAQLHNDYFNIASSAIADNGNIGSISIGGDYKSGDKGGRYYLSTIPAAGLGSETTASIIIQDITYTAVDSGNSGNSIRIAYGSCGAAGCTPTVTVSGTLITVAIDSVVPAAPGTDADAITLLVNGDASASALVQAVVTGTGATLQTLGTSLYLTGGSATSGTTLGDVGFTVLSPNAVSIIFIPGSTLVTNIDNIAGVSDFIVVTIEDGVTTAQQIVDSINAAASSLVTATVTGSNVAQVVSGVKLAGGSNATVTESGMTFTSTNNTNGECAANAPILGGAEAPSWNITTTINGMGTPCIGSQASATLTCATHNIAVDLCQDSGEYSTYTDVKNALDNEIIGNVAAFERLFETTFPAGYSSASMGAFTATFSTAATPATLYRAGVTFTAGSNYVGADGNDWTVVYLPYNVAAGIIDVGCTVAGSVAIPNIDLAAVNDTCINANDKALYVVVDTVSLAPLNTDADDIDTAVQGIDGTPATSIEVVANAGAMTQSTHETVLSSATSSSIVIQDITYTAVTPGPTGDNIRIIYEDDGLGVDGAVCSVSGSTITIQLSGGTTTAATIADAVAPTNDFATGVVNTTPACSALVTAESTVAAAAAFQNISTPGYLTGGNSSGNISPTQGFRCITPVGGAAYSDTYHTYSY